MPRSPHGVGAPRRKEFEEEEEGGGGEEKEGAALSPKALREALGEEDFADLETAVLSQLQGMVRCVVALEAGVVQRVENWAMLQQGIVVQLDGETADLVKNDPSYSPEEVEAVREATAAKASQADVTIPVPAKGQVDLVVGAVVEAVLDKIKTNPPQSKAWKEEHAKREKEWEEEQQKKNKGFGN
mmetsp:Transcript_68895/g.143626  ORF Transcript_68895/g.143626 Transcript_68895/m.143626 type:complete len:185 (-) Transcript_68895:34-588(-)